MKRFVENPYVNPAVASVLFVTGLTEGRDSFRHADFVGSAVVILAL